MRRRLFILGAIVSAAVAVVGLSAAATTSSRSGSSEPAKRSQTAKASKSPVKVGASAAVELTAGPRSGRSADEIADYWTPDRMKEARPMEKTVPGGTSSSSPAPSGRATPAGTSTKSSAAAAPAKRKATSNGTDELVAGPKASSDPAEYWTQDRMDSAQPMEKTVPGGDGSGAAATPSGGTTGAGSP